jgi:hypothetical protein
MFHSKKAYRCVFHRLAHAQFFDLDLSPGSNLIEIDFSKSKKPEGFYLHFTGDEITGSSINNNPAPKD